MLGSWLTIVGKSMKQDMSVLMEVVSVKSITYFTRQRGNTLRGLNAYIQLNPHGRNKRNTRQSCNSSVPCLMVGSTHFFILEPAKFCWGSGVFNFCPKMRLNCSFVLSILGKKSLILKVHETGSGLLISFKQFCRNISNNYFFFGHDSPLYRGGKEYFEGSKKTYHSVFWMITVELS